MRRTPFALLPCSASRLTTMLLASVLVGSALMPGCARQRTWEEEKVLAKRGYTDLRSGMMLDMAEGHFASGQLDNAEKVVTDAARIDPTHPGLHTMAGRIALERGELEKAARLFNSAIALNEEREIVKPEPHYYLGVVLQRWQRHDEAYNAYSRAYEAEPDNPAHILAMGEMLVSAGNRDEAIELLESKTTYFDQSAALRASLGYLYRMEGQADLAVNALREASLLDPEDVRLREELAIVQLQAGQPKDAAQTLRVLLEEPGHQERDDLRRKLATAYIQTNNLQAARQVYVDLTQRKQATGDDWVKLAQLAWQTGDVSSTLFASQQAIRLSPQNADAFLLLGMAWQKKGNDNNALLMFDRAATYAPSNPTALVLRGLTLQRQGKTEAAAEAYRQALLRQPGDTRAKKLLAHVEP